MEVEFGSGTEDELRMRNKIKESVQENHRIPVGIRNCVRIVTILTQGQVGVEARNVGEESESERSMSSGGVIGVLTGCIGF